MALMKVSMICRSVSYTHLAVYKRQSKYLGSMESQLDSVWKYRPPLGL